MIKERLRELFAEYNPSLRTVINEVLHVEQEYISMERPRIKEQIDEIVTRGAKRQMEQTGGTSGSDSL